MRGMGLLFFCSLVLRLICVLSLNHSPFNTPLHHTKKKKKGGPFPRSRPQHTLINPADKPKLPLGRLKHVLGLSVRRRSRVVQHEGDIARLHLLGRPARSAVVVDGHEGGVVDARLRGLPLNVALGLDGGVEEGLHEDGAVLGVPGAAEGAGAADGGRDGGVGGEDLGVGDVDTVLVFKGCVCSCFFLC